MTRALANITKPGLLTTIQDLGRPGIRHLGVPLSGAADPVSLALANASVGAPAYAPALECTLMGPSLLFLEPAEFALGGADMRARLNGEPLPLYSPCHAEKGDQLTLGAAHMGARGYICFSGGLHGENFLGSQSTYLPGALGGMKGRALIAGDTLTGAGLASQKQAEIPHNLRPKIAHDFFLRALSGPEMQALPPAARKTLHTTPWIAGRRADRMGIQLEGGPLSLENHKPMASSPVFPGTVQCPPDGAPFLLLCDAQTVGGYPRIAQIIAADLPLAGQIRPGDNIWFQQVSTQTARDIASQRSAFYGDLFPCGFFR